MTLTKYKNGRPTRDVFFPRNFNSLFDNFFNDEVPTSNTFFRPSVDILEAEGKFEILLSLPGMKKDEIKLDLKNDQLSISGERKQHTEKTEATYHLGEIRYGQFSRTFHLPEDVDREAIEAKFEDGILRVSIPKGEKAKPKTIKIK